MSDLLERAARCLVDLHGHAFQGVAIVIPGQRAGARLQKYLAQLIGQPFWAPDIMDMGRFLASVAQAEQADRNELLLALLSCCNTLQPASAHSLADLLQWGPTALNDMSEVDHHLIDLDELYRDLRSYAEIDEWSLSLGTELSRGQQHAVALWQRTGQLHRALHAHMNSTRRGSSGWVAREAAARAGAAELPWNMVWCIGANALEPATTAVLRALQRRGMLQLAWDTDRYYLEDRDQEAGRFIRRSIEALGNGLVPPVDRLREQPRSIHVVAVPDAFAQAQAATNWISERSAEELAGTLIVLADESLAVPLITGLPDPAVKVNISSSTAWTHWPVKDLLDLFVPLHGNWWARSPLPVKLLLTWSQHPLFHQLTAAAPSSHRLHEHPGHTITEAEFTRVAEGAVHFGILLQALTIPTLTEALICLLDGVKHLHPTNDLVQEQTTRTAEAWQRLGALLTANGLSADGELAQAEVRQRLLAPDPIGYFGDPWEGAQVMGLLETRALGTERLLIVGANEGTLPRTAHQQTFIPHDLRRILGLPVRRDGEAIQAYHVMRALQYATDITMIYHTGGGLEPAQPSRFIAQWEHELVPVSRTTITHTSLSAPVAPTAKSTVAVQRSPWVNEGLAKSIANGLSPSALSTWLRCPLDFFHRRVLRVDEPDERSQRLESRVLGSAVHEVLRKAVTPHLGTRLSAAVVLSWQGDLAEQLAAEVAAQVNGVALDRGHHLLSLNMAEQAVNAYLRAEARRIDEGARIVPLAVELELTQELPNGIRMTGRCDRVEDRNGCVHILDLKTGSTRPDQIKLRALERSALNGRHAYALQLLIYAWAYLRTNPAVEVVRSGLIPLQQASKSEGMWLSVAGETLISRAMLEPITDLLVELSEEILRGRDPLTHEPDSTHCLCCLS
jgi:ATP-dependent helicase/nuclease subunit B